MQVSHYVLCVLLSDYSMHLDALHADQWLQTK